MARVTQTEWNRLTDREKEILKSIGISPEKHKQPDRKQCVVNIPVPYTLKVTTQCHLCGGRPVKYFDMVLSDEEGKAPHLHAVPILEEVALKKKFKSQVVHSSVCCECYQVLKGWSKEALVSKLIKTYGMLATGNGR